MRLYLIAIVIAISTAFAANAAEEPRDINWENMAPKYIPIDDPFTHLSPDQRLDLFAILGIRKQVEEGLTPKEGPTHQVGIEMTTKLKSQGLQVEALVEKAREIERIIAEQDRRTVPELQGQNVKMPGFALPLEFSDKGVTEFLLVPYLGACIHTPPPPPNQIVLVRLTEPYQLDDIYTPVVITGRLLITNATKKLSYVDGAANIESGYTMEATDIELYRH